MAWCGVAASASRSMAGISGIDCCEWNEFYCFLFSHTSALPEKATAAEYQLGGEPRPRPDAGVEVFGK